MKENGFDLKIAQVKEADFHITNRIEYESSNSSCSESEPDEEQLLPKSMIASEIMPLANQY